VLGGAVLGGLSGQPPGLTRLDGAQNLLYTIDFRQLCSTVTRGHFKPVKFLHT
jgi:uncharacterized protein (DUF1501 family)